jgi:hypothetical protein
MFLYWVGLDKRSGVPCYCPSPIDWVEVWAAVGHYSGMAAAYLAAAIFLWVVLKGLGL